MRIFLLLLSLFITSCSSDPIPPYEPTPLPKRIIDPTDAQLHQAVKDFLASANAPAATRYNYSRVDLNADGMREGIVFIDGPYGYWCGIHGCVMKIFKAHAHGNTGGFTFMNSIQPVRSPVYISTMENRGWKNIIVRVSGRNERPKNVMLKFDGNNYPKDPSGLPAYPVSLVENPSHTRLFNTY